MRIVVPVSDHLVRKVYTKPTNRSLAMATNRIKFYNLVNIRIYFLLSGLL